MKPRPRGKKKLIHARANGETLESLLALTTLREFLDIAQRLFFVHKLTEFGGNVSKMSREIDVPRPSLIRYMHRLGVK